MSRKPVTFKQVFDREHRGDFKDASELDDALWSAACDIVLRQSAPQELPDALVVYYATRLL